MLGAQFAKRFWSRAAAAALAAAMMLGAGGVATAQVVGDNQLRRECGWRWDSRTQHLVWPPSARQELVGFRPAETGQSYNYCLFYFRDLDGEIYQGVGQPGWRLDRKSGRLVFQGPGARSPAGGAPTYLRHLNYVMYHENGMPAWGGDKQFGWRWDSRTSIMMFDGATAVSADGAAPDLRGNYALFYLPE